MSNSHTLDRAQFVAGMAMLAGAYGREVDGAVQRMYYAVLSPELTTEEFEQAIAAVVRTEIYWPSPAVILAKAGRRGSAAGASAFANVLDRLRAFGGFRYFPHAEFQALDAPTREAIRAVGGLREISLVEVDRVSALERKFVGAYVEALASPVQVPPAPAAPQLAPGG